MTDTDLTADLAAEAAEEAERPRLPGSLEAAQKLAEEVNELDRRIERGQNLLKELGDRRNTILGRELPDMMDELRLENFTVDGRTFKVQNYYHASIPKEHAEEGYTWLEEHEAGDLINNTVEVKFPKDSQEEAQALEKYVRERYQMAEVERKRAVPWARLTSWFKDLMESTHVGKVLPPLEIIGARTGRVVKIDEKKRRAREAAAS